MAGRAERRPAGGLVAAALIAGPGPDGPAAGVRRTGRGALGPLDAAVALAVALPIALAATRFYVLPTAEGLWRGALGAPSPWRVAGALAAGAAAAALLRRKAPAARRPALVLALAAAPLVPLLTGRLLPLLAVQGPALLPLGAAVAAVGAAPLLARTRAATRPLPAPALFAAAFAFYAALGGWLPGAAGVQGDEPHYLVMAQSLLGDGDLDLADEYGRHEYGGFYAGVLTPHVNPQGVGGVRSSHWPGVSVLVLPGFWLLGTAGARLTMSLLVALSGVFVYRAVLGSLGRPALAAGAWAAYAFTPPVAFYAVSIYPETVALAACALFLVTGRGRLTWAAGAAAALAAAVLPWLHPKLLPMAAAGLAFTLVRPGRWGVRVLGASALAASLFALAGFHQRYYGTAALSGAGGAPDMAFGRVPWGLSALLVDRQFGLLTSAPLWALALPGLALLLRQRTGDGVRALALAAAPFAVTAPFWSWWAGSCPPARYVVPAVPALALALAAAARRRPSSSAALAGAGFALVLLAADRPRLIHNRIDGDSAMLRHLAPAVDLGPALPSFVQRTEADTRRAPVLAATLGGAGALAWAGGGPGLAAGALAYSVVAAGLREEPWIDPRRTGSSLLHAWEPAAWAGPPLHAIVLPFDLPRAPWVIAPADTRRSRRLEVPPGAYVVEVDASGDGRAAGRVVVAAGRLRLGEADLTGGGRAAVPLFLPSGARGLGIEVTGGEGRLTVPTARLRPSDVVPRSMRGPLRWPQRPFADRYRIGQAVRATALGLSAPEGAGFRIAQEEDAFLLDGLPGAVVRVHVRREAPRPTDRLAWAGRSARLGPASSTLRELRLDDGLALGGRRVLAVTVRAPGAWVLFDAAADPGAR